MMYVLEDPSATSIPMTYAMGMPMIYHTHVIMDVQHVVRGTRMVLHGTYQGTKGRCRNMLGDEGNAWFPYLESIWSINNATQARLMVGRLAGREHQQNGSMRRTWPGLTGQDPNLFKSCHSPLVQTWLTIGHTPYGYTGQYHVRGDGSDFTWSMDGMWKANDSMTAIVDDATVGSGTTVI